ncbi:hypothetical protein VM1G_05403 [Cytospora mali]|uniref:Tripeptidyl aminopeptidase n=1 Tax=Cytospora mali TaxID=578113 RepID=A0A194W0U4_CYTMA|nr:hypothetical protein VM1G_05403 [Valsa mali]
MRTKYLVWSGLPVAAVTASFDWAAIAPSENLQYHNCYDGFQCARLTVPRDWLDANNTKKVTIAITTIPAKVPSDDPSFGGTIILNPGGPGGSGVGAVRNYGHRLQAMTEGKKHYEILGFDPRGVAYTTPRADCFGEDHMLGRHSLWLEQRGIGGVDVSVTGLRRSLALDEAFGRLCEAKDAENDIMTYISTAYVARDIVEIAERVEELRHRNNVAPQDSVQHPIKAGTRPSKKQPARVMYWGISYGTVLGNTLASMFPGRMARVVLDGVDDAHDYYNGTWKTNLLDTEKVADYFYETCFEGADNCPLIKASDTSGKDIKQRIDKLISDADAEPLSFIKNDGTFSLGVLTGNDIRKAFRGPLYKPLPTGFEDLAKVLATTLDGNYTLIGQGLDLPPIEDACSINNSTNPRAEDATISIICSDADFADHGEGNRQSMPFWQDHIDMSKNFSSLLGPWLSETISRCSGWRTRPKWRFTGPFTTPPADPSLKEDAPAAPILFTSSRLDPITPLSIAYLMSNGHPGSAVLVHDTVGHSATLTGWSECFNQAIRAYFDDGIVPANGTVCDTTCKPFSKGGKCQPPAEVMAAGGDHSLVDFVSDRRPGWSFRPLGVY